VARVEKWLIQRLLADGDVIALLADRVEPVFAPQAGGKPSIVIRREKTDREYTNTGNSGAATVMLSVLCCSTDYTLCGELATAARLAIESHSEDLDEYQIDGAFILDEYDDEAPPVAAEGEPQFGVRLEVAIHHTEQVRSLT
jgi:hypothetical protein